MQKLVLVALICSCIRLWAFKPGASMSKQFPLSTVNIHRKHCTATITSLISLAILSISPCDTLAEISDTGPVTVSDVEGVRGSGGIDAFSSASRAASTMRNKKGLTNSAYQQALRGDIPVSQEPRALKRRVVAACKNDGIRNTLSPLLSMKECMNKVMSGETSFMEEALKGKLNDELIPLVKSYGSPP